MSPASPPVRYSSRQAFDESGWLDLRHYTGQRLQKPACFTNSGVLEDQQRT
jgi:hypothetical protein